MIQNLNFWKNALIACFARPSCLVAADMLSRTCIWNRWLKRLKCNCVWGERPGHSEYCCSCLWVPVPLVRRHSEQSTIAWAATIVTLVAISHHCICCQMQEEGEILMSWLQLPGNCIGCLECSQQQKVRHPPKHCQNLKILPKRCCGKQHVYTENIFVMQRACKGPFKVIFAI